MSLQRVQGLVKVVQDTIFLLDGACGGWAEWCSVVVTALRHCREELNYNKRKLLPRIINNK